MMSNTNQDKTLRADLSALLGERFPGLKIAIAHYDRWGRMGVTFRWAGFAGLLPEERFQRLTTIIPDDFRTKRLAGFVWLELAPGETVDQFLKLPRSEDVFDREADIHANLSRVGFFEALKQALAPSPQKQCGGDFAASAKVLADRDYLPAAITEAKLFFLGQGVYCDCQVLQTVRSEPAGCRSS